jgi:hypothetical protein
MVVTGSSLNLRSIFLFRFVVGLCTYTVMALVYSLINLAFHIPMDGYFSQGVGFMVFWMLNTCTILAGKICITFYRKNEPVTVTNISLRSGSSDGESRDPHWHKIFSQLLLDLLFVTHIP